MIPQNAPRADRMGTAFWTRLGVSAGVWLYVNAALLMWAYEWRAWLLGLVGSTAAIAAVACAPASLLPVFAVAAAVLYWASALLVDSQRYPGQELLAWSVISLALVLAAGLTVVLGRRLASGGPGTGLEPSPVPALPLAPAPVLRAAAEADPDED